MGYPMLVYGLPVLGIYALISRYLRKRPHLLHRPRKFPIRCQHASHRGGSGERIENTLEAFTHAQSQGTNLMELDCFMTRDGVVVVSHDNDLERQTGHNIKITETNYEDLPPCLDRLEVPFSPGRYSHGSDHRIPRLEEVFQKFPGMPINIEIKESNDKLIQKVADLVRQYNRSHISIWASFEDEVLKKCRRAHKEMPFAFSSQRGIVMILLYYVGLLPFIPLKESFFELQMPCTVNRTLFAISKGYWGDLLAQVLHKVIMRKKLIKHLEDRGIQVILWVLNEEKDIDKGFSYGVSGVMSDYPSVLRKYLDSHPHLLNK